MTHASTYPGLAAALRAVTILLVLTVPARAIDGGFVAGRNKLSQATVEIGTLTAGSGRIAVSRCSGVLISPRLVMTAAHCVRGDPVASAIILYDGAKPVLPPISVDSVSRYAAVSNDLPSEYDSLLRLSLDTAILRLARPVKGRAPVRLSHATQPPPVLRLAGAGLSGEGIGVLKTTRLTPVLVTSSGLIVAAARGAQICKGDSGGPVVEDSPGGPVLWGVASAVLTANGTCGRIVVIAPASPRL